MSDLTMFDLTGKVAVVTGGNGGLGLGMAMGLANAGANIVVAARNKQKSDQAVTEIQATGVKAVTVTVDMTKEEDIRRMVEESLNAFGQIDILVNNAGVSVSIAADAESDAWEAAWARALEVMLTAQARLVRLCLPHLEASDAGRVVNISSTEGLGASAGAGPYSVAKHGVIGLTRSLAVELGRRGVTFNCICPGPISTAMTSPIPDEAKEKFARRRVPLRRYGDPEEVAHATLSLVLPASSYINGVVLPVDGGMTIQNT